MTLHAQRAAAAGIVSNTIRLLDRSLIGDWAFALWNRASGNLSETEWQVYLERAGQTPKHLVSRFPANTIVLYLQDSPKHCHERLELRNGVDAGVPLSYLQGLHAAHLIVLAFLPKSFRQVRIPWSVYSTIRQFDDEFVAKIVMQASERPIGYFPILLKAAKAAIADIESQSAREFLEFQVKRLQSDADI